MLPRPRTVALAGLAAGAALCLGVGTALAGPGFQAGRPIPVSGPSPFTPGCNGAPQSGTNYPGSEVEPQLAVNPVDPANMIAGYQQDRFSTGGANSVVGSVSHDHGKTWKQVVIPHITRCAGGNPGNGGDWERSTDPWVSYSPDGTLYFVNQPFDDSDPNSGMAVSTSHDGGDTWSDPQTLISDSSPNIYNDKVAITADPTDSNYVYATWDRLSSDKAVDRGLVLRHHIVRHDAGMAPGTDSGQSFGPTMLARTTDHGRTWTTTPIYDPGPNNQTIGNEIVVRADGPLLDFFDLIRTDPSNPNGYTESEALIRSTDHGATWSQPTIIAPALDVGVTTPNTGANVRSGGALPTAAQDPDTGALYVTWDEGGFTGGKLDSVALAKSTDGGRTWSKPVRVNTVPGVPAFNPTVQVNKDGKLAVTYYDFRNVDPADKSRTPTDFWAVLSHDGGQTWQETHVAGSFDLNLAPNAEGLFLGDYLGLAPEPGGFRTLFGQTHSATDPTDIYTSLLH